MHVSTSFVLSKYSTNTIQLRINRTYFNIIFVCVVYETGPLQIVISVGPYTPSDTLSYEPIEDLFRYVREHKPHILIIVGPIVDATHPLIVEGKLAETFAACYDRS